MTTEEIKKTYNALFLKYSIEKDFVSKKIKKYGMIRLIVFLIFIVGIYLSSTWSWYAFGIIMSAGIGLFVFLITRHNQLHKRKEILEQLVKINKEEEKAMNWDFSDQETGSQFNIPEHLFSSDLDLFGKGGLFQYINRTSTITGLEHLAGMFSYIEKSKPEIIKRQEAVAELTSLFSWRQDFRVLGLINEEDEDDIKGLIPWVDQPPDFKNIIFRVLIIIVPLINLTVFLLSVAGIITFWHFLAYLTLPLMVAGIKYGKVNLKHNMLSRKFLVLKKYAGLFKMIEQQKFTSPRMVEEKRSLFTNGTSASKAIRNLARISNAFDTRLNLLAGFLMNIFFLWDIRQSVRLERWQNKYKKNLPGWFEVMGKVDAYISLAGYGYNNPRYIFPEIGDEDTKILHAENMGHPLLHEQKRVNNDYDVNGWGQFTILTGANMAGKSTFLRTVGVNMLLACCGAPVCAGAMVIRPVDLVTSIHTIDSLANNESYFYAELKRLQMIIEMLKQGKQIFIILDEILKGTNSRDKQSGSRALVKQLIQLDAAGIIATHDLALGELENQFPDNIHNLCFEINIEKEQLEYDYTLRGGIAENMNATILMERMGITLKKSEL